MSAGPIIKSLQILKDLRASFLPGGYGRPRMSSVFRVAKKLSTTALSQQLPGRLIEHRIPQLINRC